jgi:ARG and Rhodanese-Phosphatase-superfamily-associated Protein domain
MRNVTVAALSVAAIALVPSARAESPIQRIHPPAPAARPAPAPAPRPAPLPDVDPNDLGEGNSMLQPIKYQNLTLFPVVATGDVDTTDYLTLDEGMKSHKVRIREMTDDDEGGDVNNLTLTNRSDRPLFVMAGEVVIGGHQDRIIGKNTIVPARKTQSIPVFCVEHGRWEGRHADFRSAGALAHTKLRQKAAYEGQGDVWNEVASKNATRHTENDTGTYRETAAEQATGTSAQWEKKFDESLAAVPQPIRQRMVGYVVALNGDVVAIDVFGGPGLFGKLDGKLRRSYYAEAIDVAVVKNAPTPTGSEVRAFIKQADAAPDEKVYDTDAADTINQVGDKAASTKVMSKGAGAKAKPVYKSVTKYDKPAPAPMKTRPMERLPQQMNVPDEE